MEIITTESQCTVVECIPDIRTKDWYAWNNLMPPGPFTFHIKGLVEVPNTGVRAQLVPKEPQGINPDILLLDLVLIQLPGVWPRVLTWTEARYHEVGVELKYTKVNIFCNEHLIAEAKVENIH